MKILEILLLATATITVTARHKKAGENEVSTSSDPSTSKPAKRQLFTSSWVIFRPGIISSSYISKLRDIVPETLQVQSFGSRNRRSSSPADENEEIGGSADQDSDKQSGSDGSDNKCTKEGFYRNPDNCNKFYRCVDFNGEGKEFVRYDFSCPEGFVFDEADNVCNWPSDSEPC